MPASLIFDMFVRPLFCKCGSHALLSVASQMCLALNRFVRRAWGWMGCSMMQSTAGCSSTVCIPYSFHRPLASCDTTGLLFVVMPHADSLYVVLQNEWGARRQETRMNSMYAALIFYPPCKPATHFLLLQDWKVNQLSDGKKRRVQLLLAFLLPSKILLLDEVTTVRPLRQRPIESAWSCSLSFLGIFFFVSSFSVDWIDADFNDVAFEPKIKNYLKLFNTKFTSFCLYDAASDLCACLHTPSVRVSECFLHTFQISNKVSDY